MDVKLLFQSVDEDAQPLEATVSGTIPEWLRGTFLRNGPGKYELKDFRMTNWLDGYAVLNAFHIQPNKVTFQRRYLQSDSLAKGLKAEVPVFAEFQTHAHVDPAKGFFSRWMSSLLPGDLTDNCNVNVYSCRGAAVVATETCFLRVVDPTTLHTSPDKVDLGKAGGVDLGCSHPHVDADGTLYNIGTSFLKGLKYTVFKTPPASSPGSRVLEGSVVVGSTGTSWKANYSYFHSFGMSENYLVLVEQPLLVNVFKLATSKMNKHSFRDCMDWSPAEKVKFIVMEKSSGRRLRTEYTTDTFFSLHHINAYEDDGHLVVDLVTFQSPQVLDNFRLDTIAASPTELQNHPVAKRWVLPLPAKTANGAVGGGNLVTLEGTTATAEMTKDGSVWCSPQQLFQGGFDFPQINYKHFNGKPYRFVYGTGFFESGITKNSLCKGDTVSGSLRVWNAGEDYYCGEPKFIPSPDSSREDDGVLVAGVCSSKADREDYLVVLDAATMEELARAYVPVRVPLGTHGIFLPS